MKQVFALAFILFSSIACAQQRAPQLEGVGSGTSLKLGEGIVYGNFIQKLSFWKSGYQQYIYLRNKETNAVLRFQVKGAWSGARVLPFCYYIPAGTYEILSYFYNESKWYGTRSVSVPIFKNIDMDINVKHLVDSGVLRKQDLHRFAFRVEPGSLTYTGTWHFDAGTVFFTNEKAALDEKIKNDHEALSFDKAVVILPD